MPSALLTITNLTASSVADFLINADQGPQDDLRFVGLRPARYTIALDATAAASAEVEIFAGGRTVVERSAVDAGGTAGVLPNLQQKAQVFFAAAGETVRIRVRETAAAGTVDLNLYIDKQPL